MHRTLQRVGKSLFDAGVKRERQGSRAIWDDRRTGGDIRGGIWIFGAKGEAYGSRFGSKLIGGNSPKTLQCHRLISP